jgi:predicted TIM-barrel fold metal-dependent hydrolase
MRLSRREFFQTTAVAGAVVAGGVPTTVVAATDTWPKGGGDLTDVNVSLSRWPFRRLPLDETDVLVARLRSRGVRQAWAGSFDGLLHKDLGAVNARLADECRRHGRGILLPFGSINPKLPDWQEELRRCQQEHKMRGIRVHPNYHRYKLDEPEFGNLLQMAEARGLIVQLAASMEDERMQHALVRVANVDLSVLPGLVERVPQLKLNLLNWSRAIQPEVQAKLAKSGQVWFDIAMVEGVGGVGHLLETIPAERVLFGSHAPFYYFESAALKLKESVLSREQAEQIRGGNAAGVLHG